MENRFFTVSPPKNPAIKVQVATGHFTTGSAHISHYIDVSELKSSVAMAKGAAHELAVPLRATTLVDMIVCMDGTEIVAAYLADELLHGGAMVINNGGEIRVVTPMNNTNGQLIFHQNVQEKISGCNVLLMVASISTGKTIHRIIECISYYGGNIVGISSIFSAIPHIDGVNVNSLFTCEDIPDYYFYRSSDCVLCKEGHELDAIVNSEGYTKI